MRFAYADPPYLGSAVKFYGPEAAPFDTIEGHAQLIDDLANQYDGFALSLGTNSLHALLPLCPPDVRVLAWTKTWTSFKPGVRLAYAWEPVILRPLRMPPPPLTVRDWAAIPCATRRGFYGAKPEEFCLWVFRAAGLEPDDDFLDLFPGSGAVGRAWDRWISQRDLLVRAEG